MDWSSSPHLILFLKLNTNINYENDFSLHQSEHRRINFCFPNVDQKLLLTFDIYIVSVVLQVRVDYTCMPYVVSCCGISAAELTNIIFRYFDPFSFIHSVLSSDSGT